MTGRTRTLLIAVGVAVVAALVIWKTRGHRDQPATTATAPGTTAPGAAIPGTPGATGPGATGPGANRPGTPGDPAGPGGGTAGDPAQPGGATVDPRTGAVATGGAPVAPGADVAGVAPEDRETRTYVLENGAVIRDHRGAGFAPPIAPPPMPPNQRTMSSAITARIYQQLAPMVGACAKDVPAADRGDDPFVYVTMTVQVAAGQLVTSDVFPTISGVNGTSATGFPACVTTKAKTITLAVGDEPDHVDYRVQYPIRLR